MKINPSWAEEPCGRRILGPRHGRSVDPMRRFPRSSPRGVDSSSLRCLSTGSKICRDRGLLRVSTDAAGNNAGSTRGRDGPVGRRRRVFACRDRRHPAAGAGRQCGRVSAHRRPAQQPAASLRRHRRARPARAAERGGVVGDRRALVRGGRPAADRDRVDPDRSPPLPCNLPAGRSHPTTRPGPILGLGACLPDPGPGGGGAAPRAGGAAAGGHGRDHPRPGRRGDAHGVASRPTGQR